MKAQSHTYKPTQNNPTQTQPHLVTTTQIYIPINMQVHTIP